jgi:hypothetical protein
MGRTILSVAARPADPPTSHLPAVVARDRTPRWTTLMWRKTISPGPLPRIGSSQLAGLVLYPEPTEEVRHVPIGCRSSVATNIGPVELADVAIPSRTSTSGGGFTNTSLMLGASRSNHAFYIASSFVCTFALARLRPMSACVGRFLCGAGASAGGARRRRSPR